MITQMLIAGGESALANAYIAAMTTPPSSQRRKLIIDTITMIERGVDKGKLDGIYIIAAHDQQAARLNVMDPTQALLTIVGTPSWVADNGLVGAAGSVWRTPYNLNALSKMKQDSNHVSYWSNTESTTVSEEIGAATGLEFAMCARRPATYPGFNAVTASGGFRWSGTTDVTSSIGHRAMDRSMSGDFEIYADGQNVTASTGSGSSGTRTSTALPSAGLNIGTSSRNASGRRVSFVTLGASLTAAEHLALSNAVHYYMSNL